MRTLLHGGVPRSGQGGSVKKCIPVEQTSHNTACNNIIVFLTGT